MTKGTYYIRRSKGLELRTGWIYGDWGLTREKTGWIATDIATGTAYNTFGYSTRAELVQDIEQSSGCIAQARQTDYYKQLTADMSRMLKGVVA